jgi:hypothetical protein
MAKMRVCYFLILATFKWQKVIDLVKKLIFRLFRLQDISSLCGQLEAVSEHDP